MRSYRSAAIAAFAVSCCLPAAPSAAQSGSLVEEIVVTARKREENLQETPVAVTAFTREKLASRNIDDLLSLQSLAPNLVAGTGTLSRQDGNFFIRGIGQPDAFTNVEPGVGTYVDGVYLGRTAGAALDLVDVERVEVLRGPQGTLFGRNTIGGAINIVTRKPGEEPGFVAAARVGERSRFDAWLAADVPLVADRLFSRVLLLTKNQDGYAHGAQGEFFSEETLAGRLGLRWLPHEDWTVDFAVDVTAKRGNIACLRNEGVDTSLFFIPDAAAGDFSEDRFRCFTSQSDIEAPLDAWGAELTAQWQIAPSLSLKSITSYRSLEQFLPTDQDATTFRIFDLTVDTEQDQLSQELQLSGSAFGGGVEWVTGVYYYDEDVSTRQRLAFAVLGPDFFRLRNFSPRTESLSGYGHASWYLTERFSLTGGLRVNRDERSMPTMNANENAGTVIPTVDAEPSESWTSVTPKLGFEYRTTRGAMVYASYSEGFRAGGFNARAGNDDQAISFDPEEAAVYEVGVKSDLLGNRLRANFAAFYTDYEDIQILTISGGFASNRNGGDARIKGAELELVANPVGALLIDAAVGYTDAEFTELVQPPPFPIDSPLPYTPELTASLAVSYAIDFGDGGTFRPQVDYRYTDDVMYLQGSPIEPGYGLVNARLSWEFDNDLSLALYALNLFDEEYAVYRQADPRAGIGSEFPGPPREVGLELRARF